MHFRKASKPPEAGIALRCLDCSYEPQCPYSAKRSESRFDSSDNVELMYPHSVYLDRIRAGHTSWPVSPLVDGIPDIENITMALKTGPYGKCVYESDNDVADNQVSFLITFSSIIRIMIRLQVVNMEFSSGATCSFTMVAFTTPICDRQTRLHFSHGEIVGDMNTFTVTNFHSNPPRSVLHRPKNEGGGHGGGDLGLIRLFVEAVRTGRQELLGTDIDEVLRSHMSVFAAETSKREGRVIDVADFHKHHMDRILGGEVGQSAV